ncbi:MAG: DUF808 domain-containing protein [Chakrabartia sp.]
MATGLAALLDDIAMIAKLAAASLDDVGAAAGKAGAKAAGVVIDDTAVTPRYVTGFTPDRELPVIYRIARGSMKNKLLFILPAALLLSAFLPWAITPILMLGGSYLCFEGVEKLVEAMLPHKAEAHDSAPALSGPDHEAQMISGAIRTDLILSTEIMAIALAEVADKGVGLQAAILALVAIVITVAVYGVVGLIVKMDDIGLHLAKGQGAVRQRLGVALVRAMPHLLTGLSGIGIAAMIWVGGGIFVHGLHEFHLTPLPDWIAHAADKAAAAAPVLPGVVHWTAGAIGSGLVGLVLGGIIVAALHLRPRRS